MRLWDETGLNLKYREVWPVSEQQWRSRCMR